MIRKLKIVNYKSLKNVEVTLSNLMVIFGANAVGKSNLFDALNLLSRLVTQKNLKEAFAEHRGVPIEAVHYAQGTMPELQKTHTISFAVEVELSEAVVQEVETRIRELSQDIEGEIQNKSLITDRVLRYEVGLQIELNSGQMAVVNESMTSVAQEGGQTLRQPFLETVENQLHLWREGQSRPTVHQTGLDYTIVSTALYPPHYPHLTAFQKEMSHCHGYYFEPRALMRAGNNIAQVTHLGSKGEDLAAFYHTLAHQNPQQFKALKLAAKQLLPRLTDLEIERTDKSELFLRIWEEKACFSNRLISEGTLRVLGLLAALSPTSGATTLCYEEPENGVHPRRLRPLSELIKNVASSNRQILINTHSPILPTYFNHEALLVCRRDAMNTVFMPCESDVVFELEEQIIQGEFGG
ncbi:MAG: AAA family ATPase [Candidatus Parabeggiatoa sp.]|nr:AAA family ATPase [Candidatus Parabeggiatoa sp.]